MKSADSSYSKTFNNLCHFLALTKDGKELTVVDNLVATTVVLEDANCLTNAAEIANALDGFFGLHFEAKDIDASVARQLSTGVLIRDTERSIVASAETRASILKRISDANALEVAVREGWLSQLRVSDASLTAEKLEMLWKALKLYMTKAFKRHGAQTVLLLKPNTTISGEFEKSLSSIITETVKESPPGLSDESLKMYTGTFFRSPDADRSRYISQLLDGTFSFFSVCVDAATSELLRKSLPPLSIFLDTNFVFGLLKLHDNPLNDISDELMDALKGKAIPFKIYYHTATLQEYKAAFERLKVNLETHNYSPTISRAALRAVRLNYLEEKFHEQNARQPINVDAFLAKYRNVEILLSEKGFNIYREAPVSAQREKELETQRYEMVADYLDFLARRWRIDKGSHYAIADHDMALLQSVRLQRKAGTSVLDVGAIILTADSKLHSYEWLKGRTSKSSVGQVLLPNQFLQIVRPYLTVTEEFDRRFAETFAIAEFRTANTGYDLAASKVLGYLSTFTDVSEEAATRILANEVFINKILGLDPNSMEFKEAVKSELISDNARLIEENRRLQGEAEKAAADIKAAEVRTIEVEAEARQKDEALRRQMQVAQDLESRSESAEALLEAERRAKEELNRETLKSRLVAQELGEKIDRLGEKIQGVEAKEAAASRELAALRESSKRVYLWIASAVAWTGMIVSYFYFSSHWQILTAHPKRLPISICSVVLITSIVSLMLARTAKTRLWIVATFVFATILALTQIL